MDDHLIIFIRNPELGKVKTRLAATLGHKRALEVYISLLALTRNATLGVDCQRHLYYSDVILTEDDWDSRDFMKHVQQGSELGNRMRHAFSNAFAAGASKVVIIGSDCPELHSGIITDAFAALESSDVVLGPATDGGYYLLGMKNMHHAFFENKQWSSSQVKEATLADAHRLGLSVHLLAELSDLDDAGDLQRWQAQHTSH